MFLFSRCIMVLAIAVASAPAVAADRDRYGDPLPAGAVARLGTVRFRLAEHSRACAAQLSPDGKHVAVADDRSLRVWDTVTGATVWRAGLIGPPQRMLYTADGAILAVGDEWRVRLLNAKTGRLIQELDHRGHDLVSALAFSTDGKWLAVAARSNRLTVWDAARGERVFEQSPNDRRRILDLAFSADGTMLTILTFNGVRI